MTKKLISFLCALALLASMVTIVATVTAGAEKSGTAFGDFSDGKFALSRVIDGGTPQTAAALNQQVLHDDTYGFGDVLVLGGSASQTRTVTAIDSATYDLSNGFTASWSELYLHNSGKDTRMVVTIGPVAVVLDRATTAATGNADVWVEYKGSVLAGCESETLTLQVPSADTQTKLTSFWDAHNNENEINKNTAGATNNKRMGTFTISYTKDGKLTVVVATNGNDNVKTYTSTNDIASSEFAAAQVSLLTEIDKTSGWSQISGFSGTANKAAASSSTGTSDKIFSTGYSMIANGAAYAGANTKNVLDGTANGLDYVTMWSRYAAALTANDAKTYDLGNKFELSFLAFFRQDSYNSCHAEVNVGDLTILVTRDGAYTATSADTENVAVIAKYKGTEITGCNSGKIDASPLVLADVQALYALDDQSGANRIGVTTPNDGTTAPIRRAVLVNAAFDNGALTVTVNTNDGNGGYTKTLATLNGTITDTDLGTEKPVSVVITNGDDSANVWNKEMFVARGTLTTYAAAASTSSEDTASTASTENTSSQETASTGSTESTSSQETASTGSTESTSSQGTASQPSADAKTLTGTDNLLSHENASKWTLTYPAKYMNNNMARDDDPSQTVGGLAIHNRCYAGVIDMTTDAQFAKTFTAADDIQTILAFHPQTGAFNFYMDFDYADTYNLGKNFAVKATMYISGMRGAVSETVARNCRDVYVELDLGNYALRLNRDYADSKDDTNLQHWSFRAILLKKTADGQWEEIGKSEVLDQDVCATYNDMIFGDRYADKNSDEYPYSYMWNGSTANKNYRKQIHDGDGCEYNATGDLFPVGQGSQANKEFTFKVTDGKLQVLDSAGKVIKFGALDSFQVGDDDFSAVKPHIFMQADMVYQIYYPMGVTRMSVSAAETADELETLLTGKTNEGGSGNEGNSGSGNSGNTNNGGAAKTGDERSILLPIAIMMACISAAGLILVNRKQRA